MNKCDNCGGEIIFTPEKKGNKCNNCGSVFSVEFNNNFIKKALEDSNKSPATLMTETKNLQCKSCGANMILNKLQTQISCPYCGNTTIVQGRNNKILTIDSVVPFKFSKEEALKMFKKALASKFFVKKGVFHGINLNNITGIYVNAFVFDMATHATYSGVFSYTESVRKKDGTTELVTEYKRVHGQYQNNFNNVTVEANSHIDQSDLHEIMPFNYAEAVEFKEDFMNGYMLEYEDSMFADCVKKAEHLIRTKIEKDLLKQYNCERIVNLDLKIDYLDRKYNYCLLPFYLVTNKHRDKQYTSLINGQTGKIGKLPANAGKIILTILLILGIVAGFIFLAFSGF